MNNEYAEARSWDDGIEFIVPKESYSIFATKNDEGAVEVKRIPRRKLSKPRNWKQTAIVGVSAFICSLIITLAGVPSRFLPICYLIFIWIVIYGFFLLKSKDTKSFKKYRYHGAEHKALNYYHKNNKSTMDIEELKKMGSISWECGSTIIFVFLFFATILIVGFTFLPGIILKFAWFIPSFLITIYLWAKGWCNGFQKYVVRRPRNDEIEVALAGLWAYVRELEKNE